MGPTHQKCWCWLARLRQGSAPIIAKEKAPSRVARRRRFPRLQLINVAGTDVIERWNPLRVELAASGQYPVLLGNAESVRTIKEQRADCDQDVPAILAAAELINATGWFHDRNRDVDFTLGSWPDTVNDAAELIVHRDPESGQPFRQIKIGIFAGTTPWQVFAVLGWGGWNECPFPEEHCAIHRFWMREFGATVISVTGDTVQCIVEQPPTTREACLELAKEQFAYCPDLVDSNPNEIVKLAASLIGARYWDFWWD